MDGHKVRGLVRSKEKADAVAAHGVDPVIGSLDDADLLQAEARAADAVVNAASSDHRGAVGALISGLSGSGKRLIHSAFWGRNLAAFSLGSNSRVRGNAAVNLGWLPAHRSITRWIASDLI